MKYGELNFGQIEAIVRIPALPRPTLKALQAKFYWVGSIERDTSPKTAVTLWLGTILLPDEDWVNGKEYERRLVSVSGHLGYQQAEWLVAHQDALPGLMALLGKVYIDFPGLVVVDAYSDRRFPYLLGDGGRWDLDWRRVEYDFSRFGRFALSGK